MTVGPRQRWPSTSATCSCRTAGEGTQPWPPASGTPPGPDHPCQRRSRRLRSRHRVPATTACQGACPRGVSRRGRRGATACECNGGAAARGRPWGSSAAQTRRSRPARQLPRGRSCDRARVRRQRAYVGAALPQGPAEPMPSRAGQTERAEPSRLRRGSASTRVGPARAERAPAERRRVRAQARVRTPPHPTCATATCERRRLCVTSTAAVHTPAACEWWRPYCLSTCR